jgi:hypothetical protein
MWMQPLDVYVEDDEKMWHHQQLESQDGIHYLIEDSELQTDNLLTAGQTSYQIQLTNFKGACKELIVVVRPDADRDSTAPNATNQLFNYSQIASMGIIASDVIVMDVLEDAYLRRLHLHLSLRAGARELQALHGTQDLGGDDQPRPDHQLCRGPRSERQGGPIQRSVQQHPAPPQRAVQDIPINVFRGLY